MAGSIQISPKHGVNPCVPICVFCGKEKNELALLGRLKGDAKAPMSAVIDYEPCDECQANWQLGIPLICVTEKAPAKGAVPLSKSQDGKNLYPTAKYLVAKKEAVSRMFSVERENGQPLMIDEALFDKLVEDSKMAGALDGNGEVPV